MRRRPGHAFLARLAASTTLRRHPAADDGRRTKKRRSSSVVHRPSGGSMRLLEYQAKEILGDFDFAVPAGAVLRAADHVEPIVRQFGPRVAVKAQVRQDGRGKAGGVVMTDTVDEAREAVRRLLGKPFRGEVVGSL